MQIRSFARFLPRHFIIVFSLRKEYIVLEKGGDAAIVRENGL